MSNSASPRTHQIQWYSYMWQWVLGAARNTIKSAHNASLWLSAVSGLYVGLYTWIHSDGWPWQHRKVIHPLELWSICWPGLVWFGLVLLAFFIGHFLATPFRLARQALLDHLAAVATKESEIQSIAFERDVAIVAKESAETELHVLQTSDVPESHFIEIQSLLKLIESDVDRNKPWDMTDDTNVQVVRAHFPTLMDAIEKWNAALEKVYEVTAELEARFAIELASRGIATPNWSVIRIRQTFLLVTQARADRNQLGWPMDFKWVPFVPKSEGPEKDGQRWLYWNDNTNDPIVDLGQGGGGPFLDRAECEARLESLFWDMQKWPETLAYGSRNADSGWAELKQPILDESRALLRRHNFKWSKNCALCN